MRSYPEDESDQDELKQLKAEPWMAELLKLNPGYPYWGPHEDYMWTKENAGWSAAILLDSWGQFNSAWKLDELNECVNFYFEVGRTSKECTACDRSGLNPATKALSDAFYGPSYQNGWHTQITQDEVDALIEHSRLGVIWNPETSTYTKEDPKPTAEEVNAHNMSSGPTKLRGVWRHDGINRWILVETRAKRLGVYGRCKHCHGKGFVYTAPAAHVNLVLWWLHPRKGSSRGIEVKNIQKAELPEVFAFLKKAADRNAERFSRVVAEMNPADNS